MPSPTALPPKGLCELLARSERVFPTHPQVARYFPAASIEDARQRLSRAIERGDGPGLIIGGVGTGKSLLLHVLAAQFRDHFDIVLLACARICTRRALLQAILFELGLPYRMRDEGELRLSLLDHLLSTDKCPEGLLILVDEAQVLSPSLLDELRVMTNLVRGGAPRVRLALAGSATLEETFASPELESFSQRLSARCYLAPFNRDETVQFIRAQIAASGGAADELFAAEACAAVFNATDGVPRLVNQLCDRAMWLAQSRRRHRVDRELVQAAWADLQQLPAPWDSLSTTICPSAPADIIEFGGLQADESSVSIVALASEPSADIDAAEPDFKPDAVPCVAPPAGQTTPPNAPAAELPKTSPVELSSDPFTEKFAEEEIVIDSFAAWDDIFRRNTLRVENHRQPEFAGLVQAAIDDSLRAAGSTTRGEHEMPEDARLFLDVRQHADLCAFEEESSGKPDQGLSSDADEFEPPEEEFSPLRLATLSEAYPLQSIPLVAPASRSASTTSNADLLDRIGSEPESDNWPEAGQFASVGADFSQGDAGPAASLGLRGEDPILVIEEDAPLLSESESQVRQEDYRDLFSRLHSG